MEVDRQELADNLDEAGNELSMNGLVGHAQHCFTAAALLRSLRPEAALTIADYRKLGLIKAYCPQCFMECYLPEPKVEGEPLPQSRHLSPEEK